MSRVSWTSLFCLSIAAAACAGSPPSSLVDARSAYQRAAKGPAEKLAPDQLHAAETFLETAERTYEAEGDTPAARDRAYVAMRKAQLAEAQAGIVQANMEYERAREQTRLAERRSRSTIMSELQATRAELENAQSAAAQQSAERERALAELQKAGEVKQDARGTVLTLSGSVIFASGQHTLLPSARNRLAEVATALQNGDPNAQIVVEGHTDSTGAADMNKELSLERAETVRDALVENGVPADRIKVEGFGEERPVADNGSQAGRANNRRVEIVVQPAS